jgi:prevent-host-death family protein
MKKHKAKLPLFKQKLPPLEMTPETSGAMTLNEVISLPGVGPTIPVRAAKAKLSALLELVARGQEIIITSDGKPKAKLVKAESRKRSKVFRGMGDYLMKQPIHRGMSADEAINLDRDARGW